MLPLPAAGRCRPPPPGRVPWARAPAGGPRAAACRSPVYEPRTGRFCTVREDLQDLGPGHGLLVEQAEHQRVEHVAVLDQDLPRLVVRRLDQPVDLLVDRGGDLVGVVPAVRHVPAQERLAVAVAELARAQPLAHAVLGDHAAGDLGGLLDVVGRAGGRLVEDQFLGGAAAEQHGQLVQHLGPGDQELVLGRQRAGVAERPAARDDRHLVHRVGVRHRVADQGVAALVVGDDLPLLLRQQHALALRAGHDPVDGLLERVHRDLLAVGPRGQQRALVDHVGQVGAGEAGGAPGDDVEVGVGRDGLAAGVHLQDALAAGQVGLGHHDLAVEPAGAQQRGVEDVGPVGGRDHDHAALGVEAVQLDQHLVQRLLALVVAAAEARRRGAGPRRRSRPRTRSPGRWPWPARTGHGPGTRRRRRTSPRSPNRRSSRTARRPRRPPPGRAGSCRCPAGRRAARPWGSWPRWPGTWPGSAGTP